MSKAEILAEVAKLSPQDRRDVLERLWRIEEGSGPTPREKAILDEAQADYETNPAGGSTWPEVQARLRKT